MGYLLIIMKNDMRMYLSYSNIYSNPFMTYCLMYEAWLSPSAHFNEAQCIFTGQFYLTHAGTQRKVEIFFPNILVFIFYSAASAASTAETIL